MKEIIIVNFDQRYEPDIRKIRNVVFSEEQKVPEGMDFDGRDADAVHVLVKSAGEFVGTGRMLSDGHIGRLAVLKEYRGMGFGADALKALMGEAKKSGLKRVFLGAQLHAVGFYRRLGFTEYGFPFIEVNIEHINMEKRLP